MESMGCSAGTYVLPPEWSRSNSPTPDYSVTGIVNYGIESDGYDHLVVQGNFSAFQDTVIATCLSNGSPTTAVVNDTFAVQNIQMTTGNSPAASLSATQLSLVISYASDTGPDSPSGNGLDDITLTGQFNGSGNDVVWAQCDGAVTFTQGQATSAATQTDTTSEVIVAIPTPQNFYTCQFFVTGNNIVGGNYATLQITSVADLGTNSSTGNDTIQMSGSFVGPATGLSGDQVWVQCDNATSYTEITAANMISDGYQSIEFLIPTPLDINSCTFYVIGNNVQSQVY